MDEIVNDSTKNIEYSKNIEKIANELEEIAKKMLESINKFKVS